MKTLLYVALFCAICVAISEAGGGGGFFGKKMMEKFKKCGDGEINIEEAMKGKKECYQEATTQPSRRRRSPQAEDEQGGGGGRKGKKKGKGGMFGMMKKKMCGQVCQWKKTGMLDDSGSFSESGAEEYAKRVYPENFQANATAEFKTCSSENSSKFSMDDDCAGYADFKKCIYQSHFKICGGGFSFGGFGGKGKGGKGGGKQDPPPEPQDDEEEE